MKHLTVSENDMVIKQNYSLNFTYTLEFLLECILFNSTR